ncbi:MAG: iron donor protein CyaY [Alphaproteobacteria bacterium]|nr:iron donor protein CyaY [Alphaproteobacteria bacterium]MDI9329856.1 iron donor protein CyaY [Alphaproteobacteria bacterium]
MNDLEYLNLAEDLLRRLEQQCDQFNEGSDADIDNQRVGGMVTLVFPDRSQIVVNLQKPLQEVWLATRHGGYHYKYAAGQWADTKGGPDFWSRLSQDASSHAVMELTFSA